MSSGTGLLKLLFTLFYSSYVYVETCWVSVDAQMAPGDSDAEPHHTERHDRPPKVRTYMRPSRYASKCDQPGGGHVPP